MYFAAVHLDPLVMIPLGLVVVLVVGWYWHVVGMPGVPPSRRRIRRFSLILIAATMICMVPAMSFIDHALHPAAYVLTWSAVLILLVLVLATAVVDLINNLRLQEQAKHERAIQAAAQLRQENAAHNTSESSGDSDMIDTEHQP